MNAGDCASDSAQAEMQLDMVMRERWENNKLWDELRRLKRTVKATPASAIVVQAIEREKQQVARKGSRTRVTGI